MSFDYRFQTELNREFDRSERRFSKLAQIERGDEEALSALFEEKLRLSSSLAASSIYTTFLYDRSKTILDGVQ